MPTSVPVAGLPEPGTYGPAGRSAWLDVDWREHRRFVDVRGQHVNVVDLGAGEPPIVFVHGLAGSWQNWLENVPYFAAAGHRVVALDLPGFGASGMPDHAISIPGYGRLVNALLDELGIGPAVLVGNSMGGFIAAEVAIQYPPRVERLVLVSAAGLTVEYQRNERALGALRRGHRLLRTWGALIAGQSEALARRPRSRRMLFRFIVHRPDMLPAPLVSEQLRTAGHPGFVDALDALTDYPIRARLGEIACPTLIVWGAEDRIVPPRDADEFERLIPNARKVVWAETGHLAMLERPEAFNRLVEAFVAEEPGERVEAAPVEAA